MRPRPLGWPARPRTSRRATLFGPGTQRLDGTGINWQGQQVFAAIVSDYSPGFGAGAWLHVDSQDLRKALEKEKTDKLKAENAL